MSRAPLALALVLAAPSFVLARESKPPLSMSRNNHPALAAAACRQGAPPLLFRTAAATPAAGDAAGDAQPQETPPPTGLPTDSSECARTISELPDDTELAFMPPPDAEGRFDPATLDANFKRSMKVGEFEVLLQKKAKELGVRSLDQFERVFDNSRLKKEVDGLEGTLRATLLSDRVNADAKRTVADAVAEAQRNPASQPYHLKTKPVPLTRGFDREALQPPEEPASSVMSKPKYTDGASWWTPRSEAPSGTFNMTPNYSGVQAKGDQPVNKSTLDAPVWRPFLEAFQKCMEDPQLAATFKSHGVDSKECKPYNYGIWRAGAMCHGVGAAIDLHAIKCGDRVHTALQNGLFSVLIEKCMIGKKAMPKTIWHECFVGCSPRNVTNHHYDHAHLSIGCGRRTW